MKNIKLKAFSIPELAIVILVVGVIIAAIGPVQSILRKNKINVAQTLTNNSPIQTMDNLVYWFETSKDDAIAKLERNQDRAVSRWNDLNPHQVKKLDAIAGSGDSGDSTEFYYNIVSGASTSNTSGPTYVENGANGLPSLRFANNNTGAYQYLIIDENFKIHPQDDITMFFVMKYHSGSGWIIHILCRDSSGTPVLCSLDVNLGMPLFGAEVDANSHLWFYPRSENGNFGGVGAAGFDTGLTLENEQTYLVTLERIHNESFTVYINGTSSFGGTSTKTDSGDNAGGPITLAPLKIGRHNDTATGETVDWELSEILLFSGKIHPQDRDEIEDYLGEKYHISISHD